MRLFRPIACAALVASASACTVWYLTTDPYKDAADSDVVADVALVDVMDASAPDVTFVPLHDNVGALAVYADELFANIGGQVYGYDEDAGTLALRVAHDAGQPLFHGIAVNDGGIYWTADDGIWFAQLDGSVPKGAPTILDGNGPWVLALDGLRLSWTTHTTTGSTAVIHSCAFARSGCSFEAGTASGANGGGTGEGGPSELAGEDAGVTFDELAAGSGYVAWVRSDNLVAFTLASTKVTTTFDPGKDLGVAPQDIHVAADDGVLLWSEHAVKAIYLRKQSPPATSTTFYQSASSAPQSTCFGAAGGAAGICVNNQNVEVIDETDGNVTAYDRGTISKPQLIAITSRSVFVVDDNFSLFRIAR